MERLKNAVLALSTVAAVELLMWLNERMEGIGNGGKCRNYV